MENQSDEFEYSLDDEMCKSLMLTLANPRIVNPTWFVNEGGKLYFYACALVSIQQTPIGN